MSSTSVTPHNSSFLDNVHISKLPRLPDEIDHTNPTNTIPGDLSKEARVSRSAQDRSQAVHRFIEKLFGQALPGVKEVEQYFLHLYRRNCRPNTFRITYNVLVSFLKFLKEVDKDRLEVVNRVDIEAFIEHEQDRGLKITTVKTSFAILKAFFRFLMEKSVVGQESFPWKMKIKLPETLPRAMAPEDVGLLLSVNGKPRDRAMIMLLLRTGMRIGELLTT